MPARLGGGGGGGEGGGGGAPACSPLGTAQGTPSFASLRTSKGRDQKVLSTVLLQHLPFTSTTPVQAAVIPLLLSHKDVCVSAETGSGKTLAFCVPAVEIALNTRHEPNIAVLILSPTRELASQTAAVIKPLLDAAQLSMAQLTGGKPVHADAAALAARKPPNVLIGTPGRVADAVQRAAQTNNKHVLRKLELLVLDEADRLLDLGFQKHVDAILSVCNKQRRTGLFSATQTEAVSALARSGMRNPTRVALARTPSGSKAAAAAANTESSKLAIPESLTMQYAVVPHVGKWPLLCSYIRAHANEKVLIYVLTCASVRYYAAAIKAARGGAAGAAASRLFPANTTFRWMHGKMPQSQRQRALAEFEAAPSGAVLLCTDVAARGLDFQGGVDRVVQLDAPKDVDTFVHRCGRCGRMGRPGTALAMLAPHEVSRGFLDVIMARGVTPPAPAGGSGLSYRTLPSDGGNDIAVADTTALAAGWERFHAFSTLRAADARRRAGKELAGKPPESPPPIAYAEKAATAWRSADLRDAPQVLGTLRQLSATDRSLMELGVEAFVSQIKGYKEHALQFVLRWKDLDVGGLATSFGILRAPAMPEVSLAVKWAKWWRVASSASEEGDAALPGLVQAPASDVAAIAYRDEAKEKARLATMHEKERLKHDAASSPATASASSRAVAGGKGGAVPSKEEPPAPTRETGAKRYKRELQRDLEDLEDDYREWKASKRAKQKGKKNAFM